MATPKANNDHFSAKKTKFSRKEFIHSNSRETHRLNQIMTIFREKNTKFSRQKFIPPNSHESADLTKIAQISCISRLQGPIPEPSQTNILQLIEFRPTPAIAHS